MALLRAIIKSQNPAWGAIQTLIIKVSGAALALLMFNQAARTLGEQSFGHLAVWFNIASFLAVCAIFGQDTLIVRHAGEFGNGRNWARARGAYRYGWTVVLLSGILFAGITGGLVVYSALQLEIFYALALMAFILMQTLLHYASHACRTFVHFRLAEFCREILWRCSVVGVLWYCLLNGMTYSEPIFFFSAAAGMAFAVVLEIIFIHRTMMSIWGDEPSVFEPLLWGRRSSKLWFSATLEAASQYIDVIIVGLLVHPIAAGGYFVAVRIANVFPMISSGLHTFLASRMAAHFYDGERQHLQNSLCNVMLVAAIFIVILLLFLIFSGSFILSLFGDQYRNMYGPLLILGIGTSIYALTGPHSVLLLTTGHETLYLKACIATFVMRIIALFILVPLIGVWGSALAWSGTVVPLGIVLVVLCRKYLAVDPSILSLFQHFRLHKKK